ncbi:hypothetical protein [Streptomyces sviceus]|uniref:hypothetical protein n=1 Tax=Streptomyces sviceus TaxID=285530 RepID=UPI00331DA9B0
MNEQGRHSGKRGSVLKGRPVTPRTDPHALALGLGLGLGRTVQQLFTRQSGRPS